MKVVITLPEGESPRIDYEVTPRAAGEFAITYTGGPAVELSEVNDLR